MNPIILAILLGGFFGFALYYVGASNPTNLLLMLRLQNLRLMKVIVFAIGLASTLVSILALLGFFPVNHFSIKTMHLGVLLGGVIFGVGFGLGGTCPGTCIAGIADVAFKKAVSAVMGALIGAFIFSISYGTLARTGLFDTLNLGKLTLFQISDKFPSVLSIGFSGLLIAGIVFMVIGVILPEEFLHQD